MKPICFYFEHIKDGRRCADSWGTHMWLRSSWEHPTNWLRRNEDTSKAERSGKEPSQFIFAPTLPLLNIARCTWPTACGFSGAEMPASPPVPPQGTIWNWQSVLQTHVFLFPLNQSLVEHPRAWQASFAVGWAHGPGAPHFHENHG